MEKDFIKCSFGKSSFKAYKITDPEFASRMKGISQQAALLLQSGFPIEIYFAENNTMMALTSYRVKPKSDNATRPVVLIDTDYSLFSDEEIKSLIIHEYLRSQKMAKRNKLQLIMFAAMILLVIFSKLFNDFNLMYIFIFVAAAFMIALLLTEKNIDNETVLLTDTETFISALEKYHDACKPMFFIPALSSFLLTRRIKKIRKKNTLYSFIK